MPLPSPGCMQARTSPNVQAPVSCQKKSLRCPQIKVSIPHPGLISIFSGPHGFGCIKAPVPQGLLPHLLLNCKVSIAAVLPAAACPCCAASREAVNAQQSQGMKGWRRQGWTGALCQLLTGLSIGYSGLPDLHAWAGVQIEPGQLKCTVAALQQGS